MTRFLACLALLVLSVDPLGAAVYRWVDENGKVHFGDRPPAGAKAAPVEVETAPAPAAAPPAADRAERQRRLLEMYENERARKAEQKRQAENAERRQDQNCRRARSIWHSYTRSSGLYEEDARGNRRYLDRTERGAEEERAREAVRRWCGEDPLQVRSESR